MGKRVSHEEQRLRTTSQSQKRGGSSRQTRQIRKRGKPSEKTIELSRTGQIRRGSELRAHLSRTERTKRRAVKGPGKTLPHIASLKEVTSREEWKREGGFPNNAEKRERPTNRGLPPSTPSESSGNRKERKIKAPLRKGEGVKLLNLEKTKKENFCLKRLTEKIKRLR